MLLQGVSASAVEPTHKEVVTAVLAASAGLGGFVLVFLGLSINAFSALPGETSKTVKGKRQRAAWFVFSAFVVCIATIATAFAWLAASGGDCVYTAVISLFGLELALAVSVAGHTAWRLLD